MKALSIVAVVIAGISFVIPIYGVWTAIIASILGLISFRTEATLSGVAVGLNLVNTAFFSPAFFIFWEAAEIIASEINLEGSSELPDSSAWLTFVSIHVVILVIGIILAATNKNKEA